MEFYKLLNELMEKHNARAVDICTELNLKKSYFSRIRSGALLPSDYQMVYELSKILQLTVEENNAIALAYQLAKTETKHNRASKAFNRLYGISAPTVCDSYDSCELSNGQLLSSEEAATKALLRVAASAESTLKLYYKPNHNELLNAFSGLTLNSGARLEWLIPLEKTSGGSEHNMDSFVNSIIVLLSKKAEVKGQYVHINECPDSIAFPYYIVTEKELLLFSSDCHNALYLSLAEAVSLHCESFDRSFNSSVSFMKLYDDIGTFLVDFDSVMHFDNSTSKPDIYIIEKYPCIVFDIGYAEFQAHAAESGDSARLAQMYAGFMQKSSVDIGKIYNIFSDNGLDEFLTAEKYYEFDNGLTKSLSKEFRFNALGNLIGYSAFSDNYNPMIMRMPIFSYTNVHTINIWSDGKMLIMFNLNGKYYIALLNENSIVKAFLDYFRMLIKCGLIRSKEETLELMRKALEEKQCPRA